MMKYIKKQNKAFIYSIPCLLLALLMALLAHHVAGFGQWYANYLFPLLPNTLGRLLSPLPFSVAEFLIYAILIGIALWIFCIALCVLKPTPLGKRLRSYLFSTILCILATFCLMLVLGCTINYDRESFSSLCGLSLKQSNSDELKKLCEILITDAKEIEPLVHRRKDGSFLLERSSLSKEAIAAMKKLGESQPELSGYYPNPKPVTFSHNLSRLNLTGVFTPFTMEANYNSDVVDYVIPFTICHELAHLKGFIREDEAGFIGYLACLGSDSTDFRYSGTLNGLVYTLNALYDEVSADEYHEIYSRIPAMVKKDFADNRVFWKKQASKISRISERTNDYYLKANAQAEGTKSYGKMVDLLLAYYSDQISLFSFPSHTTAL